MTTVDTVQIEDDLTKLRQALQEMTQQKQQLDTAIVQQGGAIRYAELLLERAKQAGEPSEEE